MKNYEKLLIVMLVITVITSILTVSVCAEETSSNGYTVTITDCNAVSNNRGKVMFYYADGTNETVYDQTIASQLPYTKHNVVKIWKINEIESSTLYYNGEQVIDSSKQARGNIYDNVSATIDYLTMYMNDVPMCDGSSCPATDMNYDNICDDCGNAFTFNLRNDTYNYNGFYLPSAIEDESGVIVNLNNYWHETLSKNEGNLVILNGDSTDNALLYYFSPDVVFSDGQVVTTGETQVTLYKPSTNENGYLYWKKSATDTWNTSGALVASVEHVDWVANAVTDENGYTAINGDVNFQTPLWVEIQGVTEGEMTVQLPKMGGTTKILVVCGVGLMACLVVLGLFTKRSLIFRN